MVSNCFLRNLSACTEALQEFLFLSNHFSELRTSSQATQV
jgi:hypothetical protein